MPTLNLSDGKTISGYVGATNAQLQIMSVPTQFLLQFPAFLTDFSQTFDAKWNTEEVFGRMDPIATYQGTKRTMSLGFDLPAGSTDEAKKNLEGCSELVKMVYPVYGGGTGMVVEVGDTTAAGFLKPGETLSTTEVDGFQEVLPPNAGILIKPPLVRIKFANLITGTQPSGLLGWISGLSWKPNLEMGMFTTGESLFPKVISLSFSFNVLHEKTPSQKSTGMFPFGG
jgi:hypothetical protein